MKLIEFTHQGYIFNLSFSDGRCFEVDLSELIQQHVSENQLSTAQIDPDWGCLEFNQGNIDIEPSTLYNYCLHKNR